MGIAVHTELNDLVGFKDNDIEKFEAFAKDSYSYLEISDYNTTGIGEKPFQSLMQGIFKSTKATSGSQGSKGVGKTAYYASSYLRTMVKERTYFRELD